MEFISDELAAKMAIKLAENEAKGLEIYQKLAEMPHQTSENITPNASVQYPSTFGKIANEAVQNGLTQAAIADSRLGKVMPVTLEELQITLDMAAEEAESNGMTPDLADELLRDES